MAFASLVVKISGDITALDRATRAANENIRRFGDNVSSIGQTLVAGLTLPLAGFTAAAVKTAADLEALKMGLAAVTGSAGEAEKQFASLKEVAKLPGLGLEEAVRGATNLQAVGFSAAKSKEILLQFGNALASVGRGRADLEEVVRQLGQLASRGKVTADNLKPIIERVPQAAAIIRKEFGTIDTEALQKLGISSEKMVDTLLTQLGRLPRVAGGLKNDFENLKDSATIAMAEMGKAVAPFAKMFIDEFAVPAIDKVKALGIAFQNSSDSTKRWTVSTGVIATAAPLAVVAIGTLIEKFSVLNSTILSSPVGLVGTAGALMVAGLGAMALTKDIEDLQRKMKAQAATAREESTTANTHFGSMLKQPKEILLHYVSTLDSASESLKKTGSAASLAAMEADKAAEKMLRLFGVSAKDSFADLLKAFPLVQQAFEAGRIGVDEYAKALEKLRQAQGETGKELNAYVLSAETNREASGRLNQAFQSVVKTLFEYRQAGTLFGKELTLEAAEIDDLALRTQLLNGEIERLGQITASVAEADFGKLRRGILETDDIMQSFGLQSQTQLRAAATAAGALYSRIVELKAAGQATALDVARAYEKWTEAEIKAATAGSDGAKQIKKGLFEVSTITTQLSQDLGRMIIKWDGLKATAVSAAERIGEAILSKIIERILSATKLVDRLIGLLGTVLSKIPGIGGIFGGGAASTAGTVAGGAGTAAGGVAGAAGSVGSAAGGAASAAGGLLSTVSSVTGIVTGIGTMVSGIIGNFQMSGMNKTLDLIERELRIVRSFVESNTVQINTYLPWLKLLHDRMATLVNVGVGIFNAPGDGGIRLWPGTLAGAAAGGGGNITINGDVYIQANDPDELYRALKAKGAIK